MSSEFVPIKMERVSDNTPGSLAERPPSIRDIRIELSSTPDLTWSAIFNSNWNTHIYNMKRNATCSGNTIMLKAPLEEFIPHHKAQLEQVIQDTNAKYVVEKQAIDDKKKIEAQKRREQQDSDQKLLDQINKSL